MAGLSQKAFHRLVRRGAVHSHGIGRRVSVSHESGKAFLDIECAQDVKPLLRDYAEERNSFEINDRNRNFRKIASIPNIVILQWLKEGIDIYNVDHLPKVMAKLDDPEYAYLRVDDGSKVSKAPVRNYVSTTRQGAH